MTADQPRDDVGDLFDWRHAAARVSQLGGASCSAVENGDLALALRLLSCDVREREQFPVSPGRVRRQA